MNYKLWIMNYELQQVIPDKVSESEKLPWGWIHHFVQNDFY